MVLVRSCCCGCSLAQGTVGTGIVSTIESILYILLGALFLNVHFKDEDRHNTPVSETYFHNVGIYMVVQGSVVVIACICLFCAVKTRRRALLLPWLIIRGILLGLGLLGCIVLIASGQNIAVTAGNILWMTLVVYLFIVVFSYYKSDMERTCTQGQVLSTAPTAGFVPIPQQPQYEYKPPYGVASAPPAGTTTVYTAPNPTGQQYYPTQSYAYTVQQPYPQAQGGSIQPPPYSAATFTNEPVNKV